MYVRNFKLNGKMIFKIIFVIHIIPPILIILNILYY